MGHFTGHESQMAMGLVLSSELLGSGSRFPNFF
jgi:hypothetical protein